MIVTKFVFQDVRYHGILQKHYVCVCYTFEFNPTRFGENLVAQALINIYVVVVDPTPPTCCQQSPAPESCGSQQSLPPGGKERLHFVRIRPEVQARKGGW